MVPDPKNPKYEVKKTETRVEFEPLLEMLLEEARNDGCLMIPFEETSKKAVEERELLA